MLGLILAFLNQNCIPVFRKLDSITHLSMRVVVENWESGLWIRGNT